MALNTRFDAATFGNGLTKLREAADAIKRLDDPDLVDRALRTVRNQVAKRALEDAMIMWDRPRGFQTSSGLRFVQFPGSEDAGDPTSVSVFFDEENKHKATVEVQATPMGDDGGRLRMWSNGKSVFDETRTEPTNAELRPAGLDWDEFNDCLASQGIAAWVGYLAAVGCAAVCAGTAGAGCIVCISGLAGFGGGVIAACVRRAWD